MFFILFICYNIEKTNKSNCRMFQVVLQLFFSNKLIGEWILFALLVAGKILGLVGMIIGVPLFAIIYSIIKDITESKLRKKGLPTETSEYMKNARD